MGDTSPLATCNFPEMLARDLQISEAAFVSKNLTAGAPLLNMTTKEIYPLYPGSKQYHDQYVDYEYQDALSRLNALSAIDERRQLGDPSCDNNECESSEETYQTSDSGSDSWPRIDIDTEPPAARMRQRQQSIVTNATSVNANSCSSPKQGLICSRTSAEVDTEADGQSWIDFDTDDDDETDRAEPRSQTMSASLKSRGCLTPLAEPCGSGSSLVGAGEVEVAGPEKEKVNSPARWQGRELFPARSQGRELFPSHCAVSQPQPQHRFIQQPPSSTEDSSEKPRLVEISRTIPQRSSSLRYSHSHSHHPRASPESNQDLTWTSATSTLAPTPSSHQVPTVPTQLQTPTISRPALIDATPGRIPSSADDDQIASIIDDYVAAQDLSQQLHDEQDGLPSTQSSPPPPNVSSSEPDTFFLSRFSSRPTPYPLTVPYPTIALPPDVLDSLRIHTSNFPDTLLTTNSLTIETIQSYAKMIRRRSTSAPTAGPHNLSSVSLASGPEPAPKWKRVISAMTSSHPPPPYPPTRSGPRDQPWTRLTAIFPHGNHYLCNALYAHLVAYNHISHLILLHAAPPPSSVVVASAAETVPPGTLHRRNLSSARRSVGGVPSKAGQLLGLATGSTSIPTRERKERAKGISRKVRDGADEIFKADGAGAGAGAAATSTDGAGVGAGPAATGTKKASRLDTEAAALKEVETGLVRCIGQIVAVLKTGGTLSGSEEQQEEAEDEGDFYDDGGVLLRALREVVRLAEEGF